MNIPGTRALAAVLMSALLLTACHKGQQERQDTYEQLLQLAGTADYYHDHEDMVLEYLDSLLARGEVSEPVADFARGMLNDANLHARVAERYYARSYDGISPEKDGLRAYIIVADRLCQMRIALNDFTGSIEIATEALARLESSNTDGLDGYKSNFIYAIALAQHALNIPEFMETESQVLDLLRQEAFNHGLETTPNEVITLDAFLDHALTDENWARVDSLLTREEELIPELDNQGFPDLADEYRLEVALKKVRLLDKQGKEDEALALLHNTIPQLEAWPYKMDVAASFLLSKGRFSEAADLLDRVEELLPEDNKLSAINLDNIGSFYIPRLKANLGAKRQAVANTLAGIIADSYPQALEEDRNNNAAELAVIYDTQGKEMEIERQKARLSQQRLLGTGIALVLITAFFVVYTLYRRRAQKRLAAAHTKLQEAYDQLEETTTAKERIESELRIARDIQMSMVPGVFPEREGLDMYAEMTPAKEVGGDLYGYVLQGDDLYFCVGDVSGKGVPASLFMAQSARLFRTLAAEGMSPAGIAVRMNNALSENNDQGMFVTMFIGLLHLDSGRMDYCNCGHNAPVIDGEFLQMEYVNQPLGLWEDDPFEGESIPDVRGRRILIYTDGLNEAENPQQQLFGNDHLLQVMSGSSAGDARETIDMLKEAVQQHRAGADPNDDLTLMCIRLS